jgi:hypothetical protein
LTNSQVVVPLWWLSKKTMTRLLTIIWQTNVKRYQEKKNQ